MSKKRKRNVTHAINSKATHVEGPLYHLIWVEIEVLTSLVTERQSLPQPVVPDGGEGVPERKGLLQTLRCVTQACTSCVEFVGLWAFFQAHHVLGEIHLKNKDSAAARLTVKSSLNYPKNGDFFSMMLQWIRLC